MNNIVGKVTDTCESLWNVELVLFGMIGHKSLRRAFGSEEYHTPIGEVITSICAACFLTMCVSSSTRTFFTVGFEDLSVTGEIISGLLSGFLIFIRALSNNFTLESYDAEEIHEYFTVNRISNLAKRHEHLMRLCKRVETLFNPIFFFTILFNGIDLCCCIIMLDREATDGDWNKFSKSVAHAITLFIQIIIYCDFAHQTSELMNNIAPTIFNSPWAFCDKKVQKLLAIIMMRANKDYKFMAYGILNLDREQMTRIFKTTGSYFTLLRSFD
ncbi:odorant receptor 22c-like isoform X2 [Cotesia glomerata]|uniref:odorant receptor 22c-like isoform X2 n=1 Tax=Cotesia glomerata TaxID=32391 RepID=UPI001D028729|nr:odorant receptor 22c-like isoform X2 [Cotesia glomerata]